MTQRTRKLRVANNHLGPTAHHPKVNTVLLLHLNKVVMVNKPREDMVNLSTVDSNRADMVSSSHREAMVSSRSRVDMVTNLQALMEDQDSQDSQEEAIAVLLRRAIDMPTFIHKHHVLKVCAL